MPIGEEFFVDTNILIYSDGPGANRLACLEVLDAIALGQARGRTSAAVLEEVWHLELSGKAGSHHGLTEDALALFNPLLAVTDEAFRLAFALQARSSLGANDRLHVGTCLAHGIRIIVSADAAFDSVAAISRVDPLNDAARRQLLRG